MECYGGHRVHVRLSDVFDHYGYVEIPCPDRFIIRCCHESSIFVHKGDRVDRSKMLIVFLSDVSRVHVVLDQDQHSPIENTGVDVSPV